MRRVSALVVLIVANFMDLMDTTVVNVALPSIRADLSMSASQLEWVVSAYTLGLAATLIAGGRMGDLYGRRRLFVIGVIGFTLASLLSATADSGSILVLARALQGGFAGLMVPQVLATVQDLYEPEKRGPIFGLVGFITGTASVIGPVLAGALISADAFGIGWRSIFAINIPVGVALTIAALVLVPNGRASRGSRLDLLGAILATAAAVSIVFPLVEGRQAGWPLWCWALFALGAALIAALIARERAIERRGGDGNRVAPFIPLHLFRNRGYLAGTIANFTYQAGLVSFFLFFALYLQQALGFSALAAGLTWLGFSLGTLAASVLASTPFATRHRRFIMASGGALTAIGFVWVAAGAVDGSGASVTGWNFTPALILAGIGMGALIVPLFGATLETVAAPDAGGASGTLSMMQQIGGSLGVAGVGAVFFSLAGDDATAVTLTSGLRLSAVIAAALFACAGLATLATRDPGGGSAPVTSASLSRERREM